MRRPRLLAHGGAALTWVTAVAAVLAHVLNAGHGAPLTDWWLANVLTAVVLTTPGWVIASRRPRNVVGGLLVAAGLAQSVTALGREYAVLGLVTDPGRVPAPVVVLSVCDWLWQVTACALLLVLLLFPTGRPLTPRWRWAVRATLLGAVTGATSSTLYPGTARLAGGVVVRNPLGVDAPVVEVTAIGASMALFALLVLACVGVIVRYRRARGDERQQLKWFLLAGIVAAVELMAEFVLPDAVGIVTGPLAAGALSTAIAVAVLRHRLYDIDLVINRSLVYLALTGCLVGGYLSVVTILGSQLGRRVPIGVSMFAAALVAIALAPLRTRLQRGVDRPMYGERADPYDVLVGLSGTLGASATPEETLPLVCRTVGEALRLPYVAVVNGAEPGGRVLASYGVTGDEVSRLPMRYQGQAIGWLAYSPRSATEQIPPMDLKLLTDVATHAGVAVYAVSVTDDLRRSRRQVIEAREEERRRLRRDLHDGLGPSLAAVRMRADTARTLLRTDPAAVDGVLAGLRADATSAVADVRRLVYELRPPALDELGLVSALREQAARLEQTGTPGCVIRLDAPDRLPALAAAVEVAAYRIATEAMTNVVKHSGARNCLVRLAVDGALAVEVIDDGTGLPAHARAGVGMCSMRERATELGGRWQVDSVVPHGTRVAVVVPTGVSP